MADISVIIEVLGEKEIERATKSMSSLEGRIGTLRKALQQGRISEDQFNQGLKEIRRSIDSQFPSWQKAKASIDGYVKSLGQLDKTKAVEQATQDYRRLAAAIDPVERITQEYQRSVRTLDNALENNVITLDEYNRRLTAVKANMENAGVTFNQYGQVANVNTRRLKRFSAVGLQQVGYQLGDFAVQVQSGTNVAVAFGQQMSQLLGIFGPYGAVAGAAVAIGTAFVAPLLDARKQAKGLKKDIEDLQKTLRQEALGFGSEKQLDTYARILGINSKIAEQEKAKESARGRNARAIQGVIDRLKGEREELQGILEDYKIAEQRLDRLKENQERSNQELEVANSLSKSFAEKAEAIRKAYLSLSDEIGEAATQALVLAGIDISSGIDAATKSAAQLAANLGIAVGIAKTLQNTGVDPKSGKRYGGRGGDPREMGGSAYDIQTAEAAEFLANWNPPETETLGGGKTPAQIAQENLAKLQEQLKIEEALIGKSEERKRIIQALGVEFVQQNPQIVAGLEDQIAKIDEMTQRENDLKSLGETIKSSLGDAFTSIVDGSKSAGEAFRDMARLILKQVFEMMVVKPIIDSLFAGGSSILGIPFANGAAFNNGKVTAFADGGVVSSPTMFPMANGAGLMGEAGPEAIMPLKRGKNGKLGVQVEGSAGNVTVENHFHIAANGDDSVKRIIAQEAPKIANLTQKQILDQRARGGAFRTTFGA